MYVVGDDVGLDAELGGGGGGDGADRGDDRRAEQVGGLFLADERGEALDRGRTRERDGVDLAVEQQPIELLRRRASRASPASVR